MTVKMTHRSQLCATPIPRANASWFMVHGIMASSNKSNRITLKGGI
jgi:hypothetical protein